MGDKAVEQVNLAEITDKQKSFLSGVAYLDFTPEGIELIKTQGLRWADAEKYLSQPETKASGEFPVGSEQTDYDIWIGGIEEGLENLIITDVASDPVTGFQALKFQDEAGNTGIVYRGSDFDMSQSGDRDWIRGNLMEHFLGTSQHAREASQYFAENCDPNGNNYIYGYSLGGNQVQHTFADHHELIAEAFSMNGNSISKSLLDTPEKIAAFNSDKFNCCIIAGDIVGMSKQNELYKNNVRVIENINGIQVGFMSSHDSSYAAYDENNNFKTMDYDQMIKEVKEAYGDKWAIIACLQQAGIKSSDMFQDVVEAMKKVPEPILDGLAYIASVKDIPVIRFAVEDVSNLINNYKDKAEPTSEVIKNSKLLGVSSIAFNNGKELVADGYNAIRDQAQNAKVSLIGVGDKVLALPGELADKVESKIKDIKGFDFGNWVNNIMEKYDLQPIFGKDGKVVETVQEANQWIEEHINKETPEAMKNAFKDSWMAQIIKQEQPLSIDSICGKAQDIAEQTKINIQDLETNTKEALTNVKDRAIDFIDQNIDKIGSKFEEIAEDIGLDFKR